MVWIVGATKDALHRRVCSGARFDLISDANSGDLDTALGLTERYCVVLQTIRSSPEATVSYRALGGES